MKRFPFENEPFIQMAHLHACINKFKPGEPEKSVKSMCQKLQKLKCEIELRLRPKLSAIDVLGRCKV